MSEHSLKCKGLYFKIRINNILQFIDRKIKEVAKNEKSYLNDYFMKKLPSMDNAQEIVMEEIKNKTLLLVRFGLYEYQLCYQYLEKKVGIRTNFSEFIRNHIHNDAGVLWKNEDDLDQYAEYIIDNLKLVTVIAYWRNYPSRFVFNDFIENNTYNIDVEDLYPYPFWHKNYLPYWQSVLKNKKVLIVTSFSKTVSEQYKRKNFIWDSSESILPTFNLITYQSVCTNGGWKDSRFETWKEVITFMTNQIVSIDFDIALISCGGYGMPLSMELRKAGKNVIQWGGCYQLWFGIKGSRWDNIPEINQYFNNYWIYPSDCETPPDCNSVNFSSYWKKKTDSFG